MTKADSVIDASLDLPCEREAHITEVKSHINGVEAHIPWLTPDTAPVANSSLNTSGNSLHHHASEQGYKEYARKALPTFTGEIRDYPEW